MNKFIVLEGLDGVGKSTLARGVAEKIKGQYMSTPGNAFAEIRSVAMEAFGDDQLGRALFYASTVSAQGKKALLTVNNGYTVVMDRYWPSTIAYAKARGVNADLDILTPEVVPPDLVVLVTLDENIRRSRLINRSMTPEDQETLCAEFTMHVMSELTKRCNIEVDITGLNEQQSIDHVTSVIMKFFA